MFLIELSITQFSEYFNLKSIEKLAGFCGTFSFFECIKKGRNSAWRSARLPQRF